ncbi:hypothetical protein [Methanobrevibacter sp.]|uniref:hypothetical protein n=1 Tax=Methanobrevibacter sp. TaxID=66852 RepID=UPI00389066FA
MKNKTLYALLIILLVIYVGVNVSINGFNILGSNDNQTADSKKAVDISFPKIDGFNQTKINDSAIKYFNDDTGVTIELQKIDNSLNISDIFNDLLKQGTYTSSQKVDQNGVTTYYLYKEGQSDYSAEIYFNKNNQNFRINGDNITYENSDHFIDNCKKIIDNIKSK